MKIPVQRILILFVLPLFFQCQKQRPAQDLTAEENRVLKAIENARQLGPDQKIEALARLKAIENVLQSIDRDSTEIKIIDGLAEAHLKLGDTAKFYSLNERLLSYTSDPYATKAVVWYYYNLENLYLNQGKLDSAYQIIHQCKDAISQLEFAPKDKIYNVRVSVEMASLDVKAHRYYEANTTLHTALNTLDREVFDPERELYLRGRIHNTIASAYSGLWEYEKAIDEYGKYLEISRSYPEEEDRIEARRVIINNMANALYKTENYQKAKSYYASLLQEIDSTEQVSSYIIALTGYAASSLRAGEWNIKRANEYFQQAFNRTEQSNKTLSPFVNYHWGKALFDAGLKQEGIIKIISSYQGAIEGQNTDRALKALEFLSINNPDDTVNYGELYAALVKKTWMEERQLQDKFADVEYQANIQKRRADQNRKQSEILLGVTVALILVTFGGYVIIVQRGKNKELLWEKQQQMANQEIYDLMLSQRAKLEEGKQLAEKNISEEIHDGILGEMLGIRLILSGLNENTDEPSIEKRQQLIEQLQGLEEELRSLSHQLSDSAYKKVNEFVLALEDLLDQNCKPAHLLFRFRFSPDFNWDYLPGEIKIQLYRMLQVGLKNTIKHAKATEVDVELMADEQQISLLLKDNGIGFDPQLEVKGIGLKNLKSRIQKIKGNLEIKSAPGKGTALFFSIPLKQLYLGVVSQKSRSESSTS